MHKSSIDKMKSFRKQYLSGKEDCELKILDLGSTDIGGSYRTIFDEEKWGYTGIDLLPGKNVDIVLSDPYNWLEIESSSSDVFISGQTFEHIEYFWQTMLEIARVLKPGGLCCIIAPSGGPEHRYPVDCWRFYPDGFKALARYARLEVLEVRTQWEDEGHSDGSDIWADTMLVARKKEVKQQSRVDREHIYVRIGEIDNDSGDSLSKLIKHVEPGSTILELGPANGYLTKYLNESLNCTVDCVEQSSEMAKVTEKYCRNMVVADLDQIGLENYFNKESFDYIIIADVLEHLKEHEKTLKSCRNLLKKNGKLILSIPNISHASIIGDLLNEKFEYRDSGLLDRTHLRFFTRESIKDLLKKCCYSIETIETVQKLPEDTEMEDSLMAFPTDLQKAILNRKDALTYQFIIVCHLNDEDRLIIKEEDVAVSPIDLRRDYIMSLNERILALDEALLYKEQIFREQQDAAIAERGAAIAERDAAIVECADAQLALKYNIDELKRIVSSKSWRMTAPLRSIRRSMNLLYSLYRQVSSNLSRWIWRCLPISMQSKMASKDMLFKKFPFLFGHTLAYSAWQSNKSIRGPLLKTEHPFAMDMEDKNLIKQVPLLDANSLAEIPVRLIAFYLPQFHPIPENDEWWGKGFTEWTNVKPAAPQFVGHYQPRVPGELGYYDLRSKEVQRRQVELAKLYGISGFCFYLYWFGGKRLLELPVQNYLENHDLNLPFCVCWANENWSRRWDGLDNEILIKQNHLPEDDLAFIEYVSIYLKDSRYIRIKGKPLLIVYQPGLMPSIKKTVECWRKWCCKNNIGDIYIAYTQSFEAVNPEKYGFDGAIEFPPNNSVPPVITDRIKSLSPEFSGIVYDWNIFVERSRKYKKPDYPLFRGVCPSWDNTARRMENAGIFLGSTPDKYSEWLENASVDTVRRFLDPSERLVFVNAWNEWAEGTYLEPDQRYGYAYLQATRDALERVNAKLNIL